METKPWKIEFYPNWDRFFTKFDSTIQKQILKKFEQMKQPLLARGLHSSDYLVEEVGQYRIAFTQTFSTGVKLIHFVGNHKQYEKWYKTQD